MTDGHTISLGAEAMVVKDLACQGEQGDYHLNVYFPEGWNAVTATAHHLGSTPLEAEEALYRGDHVLGLRQPMYEPRRLAVAVSVLRVCRRHGDPVAEVVENVIAVREPNRRPTIDPSLQPTAVQNRTGVLTDLRTVDGYGVNEPVTVSYMPRESYDAVPEAHASVYASRKATRTAIFGCLGGEQLVAWTSLLPEAESRAT